MYLAPEKNISFVVVELRALTELRLLSLDMDEIGVEQQGG